MDTFPNVKPYTLEETTFIAGTYKELNFPLYDLSGSPLNISSASAAWTLSPFQNPEYIIFSKVGTKYSTFFRIILLTSDTKFLSGKFIQRPIISTKVSGIQYDYRFAQGIINIIPAGIG
jgi:hypothetical protein